MRAMRRILLPAVAVAAWLGVTASPAAAHSVAGVSPTNLQTHLKSVEPAVPGLEVKVIEAGSRLELRNTTGREALVLGYKVLAPRGFELEVTVLGKVATWILYAGLALVLVTAEGTAWPLWLFYIALGLALVAGAQYVAGARGRVRT